MASTAIKGVSVKYSGVLSHLKKAPKLRSYYTYSAEPAQPLKRKPEYVSLEEAVKVIQSGNKIWNFIKSRHLAEKIQEM